MKLFLRYLIQHRKIFAIGILFTVIFSVSFYLYHLPVKAVIYPAILCAVAGFVILIINFREIERKHKALNHIKSITDIIEKKFPEADTIDESDYQEIIRLISDEHNNYSTRKNQEYSDMVEYYTVWVHQIKTPIASMRLNLQNEDSTISRKLSADLRRIEQYVEMVLTFLRLDSDSTDYVIKEYDLDSIVKQSVKKFSHDFISRKLKLIYEPLDTKVITDEKWLSFVIEQILSNALKYTRTGSITISVDSEKKLSIGDTGIGIAPEDLPRIFENGYTGFNGRTDKKASGIGLYLCKRICSNLGHTITAESVVDNGTIITIDLSQRKLQVE